MPHTVFITSSTDQRSRELAARVEQLFKQADAATDDLSVTGLAESDEAAEWTAGDPCPHCGGTVLSVMEVTEHHYESIEDEPGEYHLEYATYGDAIGPTLSYQCLDCETDIRGIPLGLLGVPVSTNTD
jgi:hypothetical protein